MRSNDPLLIKDVPLWAVLLPILVFGTSLLFGPGPLPASQQDLKDLKFRLQVYTAVGNSPSALLASLERGIFSETAYQSTIKNDRRTWPELVLRFKANSFESMMKLIINGKAASPYQLQLLKAPASYVLKFRPGDRYQFILRADPGLLRQGDHLKIELQSRRFFLASNTVKIEPQPADLSSALEANLQAAAVLGERKLMRLYSAELLGIAKTNFNALWYRGLAYEIDREYAKAKLYYQRALHQLKADETFSVPPYQIFKRLTSVAAMADKEAADRRAFHKKGGKN